MLPVANDEVDIRTAARTRLNGCEHGMRPLRNPIPGSSGEDLADRGGEIFLTKQSASVAGGLETEP